MTIEFSRPHTMDSDAPHIEIDGGRKLFGGSFFHSPTSSDILTINLMKEYPLPCDIYIPIQDYACPSDPFALVEAFEAIKATEKNVYVGCFGGIGRTGLFMSAYLKYMGHPSPIREVRSQYHPHAVETQEQADFVANFPVAPTLRAPKLR